MKHDPSLHLDDPQAEVHVRMAQPRLPAARSRRRWTTRLYVALTLLLVGLPVVLYARQDQWCKWQAAVAMELYLNDKKQQALQRMGPVADHCRDQPDIQARWARWLAAAGRAAEGLQVCDAALDRYPDHAQLLAARVECLANLERHDEALTAYEQLLESTPASGRAQLYRLNNLAYRRGLAQRQLPQAMIDIQAVLEATESGLVPAGAGVVSYAVHIALWSALLSIETGESDAALERLTELIQAQQDRWQTYQPWYLLQVYRFARLSWPLADSDRDALRQLRRQHDGMVRGLALLYTVRAFLHDRRGETNRRDQDRVLTLRLGFDPQQLLESLPTNAQCVSLLREAATFLDTAGLIHYQLGQPARAQSKLDLAIEAQRAFLTAFEFVPWANNERTADQRVLGYYYREFGPRSLAVMLNHRARALRALNRHTEAARDEQQVRQLGFQPGTRLF